MQAGETNMPARARTEGPPSRGEAAVRSVWSNSSRGGRQVPLGRGRVVVTVPEAHLPIRVLFVPDDFRRFADVWARLIVGA